MVEMLEHFAAPFESERVSLSARVLRGLCLAKASAA